VKRGQNNEKRTKRGQKDEKMMTWWCTALYRRVRLQRKHG
jgi:hypothetical protein